MNTKVRPEHLAKARAAADALGVSMAMYIDGLLAQDQFDDDGRPLWWTGPAPVDQKELTLKTA